MTHLPSLIQDLSVLLFTAGIVSILCKFLNLPQILGYLLAGLVTGQSLGLFPAITEEKNLQVWGEIGIIFLLFTIGLEFNLARIRKIGPATGIAALISMGLMTILSFTILRLTGITGIKGVLWACVLSISSTAILFKCFEELSLTRQSFAQNVIGQVIFEDIVSIFLLVLITTLALGKNIHGVQLLTISAKLVFFLVLWFVVGIFLIPWALKTIRHLLNDEVLTLVGVGLCLMMVLSASQVGFSPALGAFVMGCILGETHEKDRLEKLVFPIRDLFAAVFFISVGMQVDLAIVKQNIPLLLLLVSIVLFLKPMTVFIGQISIGRNFKHAAYSSTSMGNIGEFSYVLMAIGVQADIFSNKESSLLIAASAICGMTTTFVVKQRELVHQALLKIVPKGFQNQISAWNQKQREISENKESKTLVQQLVLRHLVNFVMALAIFLVISRFLVPKLQNDFAGYHQGVKYFSIAISLILTSPMLWVLINPFSLKDLNLSPPAFILVQSLRLGLTFFGLLIGLKQLASWQTILTVSLIFLTLAFVFGRDILDGWHQQLESKWFKNTQSSNTHSSAISLGPWQASLSRFVIAPESPLVGLSLIEMKLRENYGVTLVMIQRGSKRIFPVMRHDRLFPFDEVHVIGTEEELLKFEEYLYQKPADRYFEYQDELVMTAHRIQPESPLVSLSIRETMIREKNKALIVCLERKDQRFINPDVSTVIQAGDLLWIVGEEKQRSALMTN